MFHTNKPEIARVYAFVNAAVVLLFVLVGMVTGLYWDRMPDGLNEYLAIRVTIESLLRAGLFLLAWAISFRLFGLFRPSLIPAFWNRLIQMTIACALAALFALDFPLHTLRGISGGRAALYLLSALLLAVLCGRFLAGRIARSLSGRRSLIIVGSGRRALAAYERLLEPSHGTTRVLGFVDSSNGPPVSAAIRHKRLGSLDDLEALLMKQPVDEVVIALPAKTCYKQIQAAINTCQRAGVQAKFNLSDIFDLSLARAELHAEEAEAVVSLKFVKDDYRQLVKRCIDLAGAIVGLALFGPLMLAIAVAIRFTSPGPALFTQERYGFHKRRFLMYKFRTMVLDAEKLQAGLESSNDAQGPVFKIRNDPRITAIGRLLRKTSLDELPQFFNVLRGHMSLVGPRPLPKRDVALFDDAALMRRFSMKPGLTCLWQVNGRSNTTFSSWIAQDLLYIDSWSLALDFRILLKTIPAVLRGTGAA